MCVCEHKGGGDSCYFSRKSTFELAGMGSQSSMVNVGEMELKLIASVCSLLKASGPTAEDRSSV